MMNDLAAGMGACMKEHSPGTKRMSTTMQTYSPMLITESKSARTYFDAAPTSSLAISTGRCRHSLLSVQEPNLKRGFPSWKAPFSPRALYLNLSGCGLVAPLDSDSIAALAPLDQLQEVKSTLPIIPSTATTPIPTPIKSSPPAATHLPPLTSPLTTSTVASPIFKTANP